MRSKNNNYRSQLLRRLFSVWMVCKRDMIKFVILALILPIMAKAGLFQVLMKQGCDFDPETTSYICVKIKDQFPKMYYGDYNLRCVYCEIEMFMKDTFPSKNTLLVFNVSESKIHTIASRAFENLKFLEHIHLENNKITNISEDAFYGLRNVFELHLEHNKLNTLTPGLFNGFEANVVVLNHNNLEEIPDDVFRGVHGIMILDLSHNSINTLQPDSLKHLNGLEILYLQGNDLCRLPVGVFKHIRGLRTLNLAQNMFSSFPVGIFSPLRDLLHLNISVNYLKVFDSTILLPLRLVRSLDISQNSLRHLDVISMKQYVPSLQWLVLNDNFWSCDELKSMVEFLKNKNIDVSDYSVNRYDITNVNGIACLETYLGTPLPTFDALAIFLNEIMKLTLAKAYC